MTNIPEPEEMPLIARSKKPFIKRRSIVIWTVVCVLIVGFLITGFATEWFGLYGPVSKIALATGKTLKSQPIYANFSIRDGSFYAEGILYLQIDSESKTIEAYLEAVSDDTTYIAAIYDAQLIYGTKKHLFVKDIKIQLEHYFSNNEPAKIRSLDNAFDVLIDLIPVQLQEKINSTYLDLNKAMDLLQDFLLKKLNRSTWLKAHAGYRSYKVDGVRYHTFCSRNGTLLSEILLHLESAFVSDSLLQRLKQTAAHMQQVGTTTELLFAIEDGMLKKYEAITHSPEKTSYISIGFHLTDTPHMEQKFNELLLHIHS